MTGLKNQEIVKENRQLIPGGGGYYHPNLGGDVPRGLQNPDPITDLKF